MGLIRRIDRNGGPGTRGRHGEIPVASPTRVTVHGSGTDAFSRRKTNIFHGRDQTPKRRLSVKMGLSPSLARERLPTRILPATLLTWLFLACGMNCQAQTVSGRVLLTDPNGIVQGDVPGAWVVLCRENQILGRQTKLLDQARFELQKEADNKSFDLVIGAPDMIPATFRGLVAETGNRLVLSVTLLKMSDALLSSRLGRSAIEKKSSDALDVLPADSDEAKAIRDALQRLDQKRVISIVVPAYFYPGGATAKEWDSLFWAAAELKADAKLVVIVNVNSGPGNPRQPDTNYQKMIARLIKADAHVIGYVRSDYGKRSAPDIQKDVADWISTYPGVSGIFFDEVSSEKKDVDHYKLVCEAARKSLKTARSPLLIGNFGTTCDDGYAADGLFDMLCLCENKWGDHKLERPTWDRPGSRAKFGAVLYGVSDKKDLGNAFDLLTTEGAAFLYFTDQKGAAGEVLWTRAPHKTEIWQPLVQKVKDWNKSARNPK